MKDLRKVAVVLLTSSAFVAGCASQNASVHDAPLQAKVVGELHPTIVVGDKISGEASATRVLGFLTFKSSHSYADGVTYGGGSSSLFAGGLAENVKALAAENAVSTAGADILVAPQYVVDDASYPFVRKVHVKVSGYKGTISKIEQVSE